MQPRHTTMANYLLIPRRIITKTPTKSFSLARSRWHTSAYQSRFQSTSTSSEQKPTIDPNTPAATDSSPTSTESEGAKTEESKAAEKLKEENSDLIVRLVVVILHCTAHKAFLYLILTPLRISYHPILLILALKVSLEISSSGST